jgi:hypothetical protein
MDALSAGYRGIVSSDWSECLSPSGPFDFIAFSFPKLAPALEELFRGYTGNRLTLGEACRRIAALLPRPVTEAMMDAYLAQRFAVYRGVPELIAWCAERRILFMLNTTGMIGYFQRVFARGLLPPVPALSANSWLRYPARPTDPAAILELRETPDKGRNTAAVLAAAALSAGRLVVMGDSGGDGPHFEWGRSQGALLVASMAKASLHAFCAAKGIAVDHTIGPVYGPGEPRDPEREMAVDFRELIPLLAARFEL